MNAKFNSTNRGTALIRIDLAKTPLIELTVDEALALLKCLEEETGGSRDLAESINILSSFDEYLRIVKRKFLDYVTPSRDQREVLEGRSIVHKLKLIERGGVKFVEIFFDRRFNVELLKKCLLKMGFSEVIVEHSFKR